MRWWYSGKNCLLSAVCTQLATSSPVIITSHRKAHKYNRLHYHQCLIARSVCSKSSKASANQSSCNEANSGFKQTVSNWILTTPYPIPPLLEHPTLTVLTGEARRNRPFHQRRENTNLSLEISPVYLTKSVLSPWASTNESEFYLAALLAAAYVASSTKKVLSILTDTRCNKYLNLENENCKSRTVLLQYGQEDATSW